MTEARAVRARIAGLGRALQDPIDQQILWHLLSAERGAEITLHVILAPGESIPGLDALEVGDRHQEIGEITPSRTAEVVRRPQPEIRVHYRLLHEAGLIERGRRTLRLADPSTSTPSPPACAQSSRPSPTSFSRTRPTLRQLRRATDPDDARGLGSGAEGSVPTQTDLALAKVGRAFAHDLHGPIVLALAERLD